MKLKVFCFLMVFPALLWAASDSVTETVEKLGPIVKTTLTWTSGTNNLSVTETTTSGHFRGELLRIDLVPITGTTATNVYTLTLKDSSGTDLIAGVGADVASNALVNLPVTGSELRVNGQTNVIPIVVNSQFTIAVTNCGNDNSSTVVIYTK